MKTSLLVFVSLLTSFAWAASDPVEVLKKVDEIRNPSGSFGMVVDIQSSDSSDISSFEVSLKGNNKTLIKTLQPARDRGRNLLMLDENMWVYIPNIKRAVRVSLAQKLTGQAANGDISRMRWSEDYTPTLESEDDKEIVLFLKANKKGLTYDQLKVWAKKSNFDPIKAEFLGVNGKVLKTAVYSDFKSMAGRVRPSRMDITDAIKTDSKSTLLIKQMEEKSFSDSLFHQKNLN